MKDLAPLPFNSETTPWRVILPAKYSPDGKRKAKYFRYKKDAQVLCDSVNDYGISALQNYTPAVPKTESEQMETAIRWALRELGDFRKIYDAVEHFKLTRLSIKPATVREAVDAFQAFRGTEVDPLTVSTDGGRLAKLINYAQFDSIQLCEINKVQMVEFFDSFRGKLSESTMVCTCKTIRKFFKWCVGRGYLGANPMDGIETKEMGEMDVNNEFYPIEVFQKMLRVAAGLESAGNEEKPTRDFIDLLPWFVISGFGGLRTCEAYQKNGKADAVKWSDIRLDAVTPHLYIRETVAKGGRPRGIDMAPAFEAMKAWLDLCPRNGDYIVRLGGRAIQALKTKFIERTGIKFPDNGLRNSFATYSLAYHSLNGLGYVAKQMGNSEAICKRHYAQWLPTGSGQSWFNFRPFEVVPAPAVAAA